MRTRPRLQSHLPNPCPVPGCLGHRKTGQLMCRACWYRVPVEKRRAVNKSWAELRRVDHGDLAQTRMALVAYRAATDDAIGSLAPRPAKVAAPEEARL